jgi:heme/copper-type cytochrome/quinol oxidase subunit 2
MKTFDTMNSFYKMKTQIARENKQFDRFFKIVATFIVIVFVMVFSFNVFVLYTVSKQDWSNGIKPVIESIWCGNPGCLENN